MLSRKGEYKSWEITEAVLPVASSQEAEDTLTEPNVATLTKFYGRYQDCMEMAAPVEKVAEYLNSHASWFARCAEPMNVQSLGENGYALTIGRFGSFGYEVEPKIGLELLPPEEGIYRIRTIPIPDYQPPGYDVDYRASLELKETDVSTSIGKVTRVEWELDLIVYLHFPRFIQRLPKSIIQSTGDRLLNQIVRQVSRRLTRKVQEDFHKSLEIPFPGNSKQKR
ncbi:MAG: DUF1997 domain-containing protein [Nostoc sp. DedQUE08]|uniref:DUF1997 domain-containing protein n=1 Tax=unclassified Nostoc TaxID=2593658 RepID=UPI002AD5ACE3|nr:MULTISPECIES: DUF1997 domain-containing protein [unclassified Nostoc]MDZ8067838.1 DUF1997 domain-containing protein [Nostoc sp. DedQUE08]MDZ8090732.1 DUF1997 domain-containing protein [Nostoc sp. DedQUE05]